MGTTYDETVKFTDGSEAYRMCSECGAPDRPDFMGPAGHFESCSHAAPGAQAAQAQEETK